AENAPGFLIPGLVGDPLAQARRLPSGRITQKNRRRTSVRRLYLYQQKILYAFLEFFLISRATAPMMIRPLMMLVRSEEHTSALQSRFDLVCSLLLQQKNHRIT